MRRIILLGVFFLASISTLFAIVGNEEEISSLKVMSKNVLFTSLGNSEVLQEIADNIKEADIIGCQEMNMIAASRIAKLSGYHHCYQKELNAIFSRYPIIKIARSREGVQIQLPSGRKVWFFNIHLPADNYGPYQINNIGGIFSSLKNFDPNSVEQVKEMKESQRKSRIDGFIGKRFKRSISNIDMDAFPVFVVGDYNEPSHLDWTQEAVDAGYFPTVVEWPASIDMANLGFNDSYRQLYPNPVSHPGFTWTCEPEYQTNKNNKGEILPEPFDRIDFIYCNNGVKPIKVVLFGPKGDKGSDINLDTFSSDHRTVMIEFNFVS